MAVETHRGHFDSRYIAATRKGVIAMHGHLAGPDNFYDATTTVEYEKRFNAIAGAGIPIAADNTGADCGNSATRTRITNLRTFAQTATTGLGFASGKVHLLGVSMGGTAVLNWAKNNLSLVQSIGLILPAVDIQDINTNNRGGLASAINTAYAGAPPDADTPAKNAASFVGIPMKIWYASDDPICLPGLTLTFASTAGATTVNLGAVGHAGETSAVDPGALANFFAAND